MRRLCSGRVPPFPDRAPPQPTLVPARRPAFPPCCPTGHAPPCLPAMTSLSSSSGSGDGGGGSSGSGGGCSNSRCGAVRWGVSGGGQMQLHRRPRETLPPQQLREWYASRSGGGVSSGTRTAAVQLGVSSGGLVQLQQRPRETLTPQQLREWYDQRGASRSSARCPYVIRTVNRPAPCTICPAANLPHEPFPTHFPGADDYQLMDKVYSDILNLPEDGFNGERYVITFTDASTRYVWTGNMTNRFLAFTAFRT
ncbi:unnamed protein product [Closterium sp. NIES-54]